MHRLFLPVIFEPFGDLFKPLYTVLRLAGTRKLVVFAAEADHLCLHTVEHERGEHLVTLIDRAAIILEGMYEECRRFYIAGIFQRAVEPHFFGVIPRVGAVLINSERISDIGDAAEGEPVGNGSLACAGPEPVCPIIQFVINPP